MSEERETKRGEQVMPAVDGRVFYCTRKVKRKPCRNISFTYLGDNMYMCNKCKGTYEGIRGGKKLL